MASCPYKKDPDWISLVAKHGELEAYYLYVHNGYKIPTNVSEVPPQHTWAKEDEELVQNLKDITQLREEILISLVTKANIFSKQEEFTGNLKTLIKDLVEADIQKSIIIFLDNTNKKMEALKQRMRDNSDDIEALKLIKDFSTTYELVYDMGRVLAKSDKTSSKKLKKYINKIKGDLSELNDMYIRYSRDILAKSLAQHSTVIRHEYKVKFAKEFKDNHDKKSFKDEATYEEAKFKYVDENITRLHDQIQKEEEQNIKRLLITAPEDISEIVKSISDPRNIKDHILQLAVLTLDNADHRAYSQFIEDERTVLEKFKNFQGKRGAVMTDQTKLYNGIIEKIDGVETQYYVRKHYSTYYEALNRFFKERKSLIDERDYYEHKDLEKYNELVQKEQELVTEFRDKWFDMPSDAKSNTDFWHAIKYDKWVKQEFVNPQFTNMSADTKQMYDFLIEFNQESDKLVPYRARLGYRLPSVDKTKSEKIQSSLKKEGSVWGNIKRSVQQTLGLVESDTEFGDLETSVDSEGNKIIKVIRDVGGKAYEHIAVPFRQPISAQNQSYDLVGMALSNRYVSLNYAEKSNIKVELEVLKDITADRTVVKRKGLKTQVIHAFNYEKLTGEELSNIPDTLKGIESKSHKRLVSLLEDRLYGKHNVPTMIGSVSMDKVASLLTGWSADLMLITNVWGAVANTLNGKTMNFLEGTRRIHYDRKNLRHAEVSYWKDMGNIAMDFEELSPNSITNILMQEFLDSSINFDPLSNNLVKDNKVKRLFNKKTLHAANTMAEHYIQGTLMYAVLDNYKILKDGKYIDAKGNVTTRENALTLREAFKNVKGKATLPNGYTVEGFSQKQMEEGLYKEIIRRKIKDVTADLQGQYDSVNKAEWERMFYAKLVLFLRKWVIRGSQRRFMGLKYVTTDFNEMSRDDKFYSEAAQEYKEGTYTTMFRFFNSARKNLISLKGQTETLSIGDKWKDLSDYEQAQIRSALTEILILSVTFLTAKLIYGLSKGDKDDDKMLLTTAYFSRRLFGELVFYLPILSPSDALRTVRTPSATLSTIESLTKFIDQFVFEDLFADEWETYQRGRHKGESKSWVMFNKTFNPLYKNYLDRDIEDSANRLFNVGVR
jgi:hypothetical protein